MTTTKKGRLPVETPADRSLLTREDREELRKTAREHIADERKQKASDAFYKDELDRERRKHVPSEQLVNIVIDSAPYVPYFMIDGQQFYNGYEYQVTRGQAAVLVEQMQRSRNHQDEIEGRSRFSRVRRGPARVERSAEGTLVVGDDTEI